MRPTLALLGLLVPAVASAQVTPTPWFLGDYSESFESASFGFATCLDISTVGNVCANSMNATSSWGFSCTIFPYSGSQLAGNTGDIQIYSFNPTISQFGGYFSTNAGGGYTVTFRFYDVTGTLIDTVVEPLNNCTWDWFGYISPTPIATVEVENSGFSGAFIMVDDIEVTEQTIPDFDGDGWEIDDGDCDDNDATINPGATEVPCNMIDEDCDPATPDNPDEDGDGTSVCAGDCDDTDPAFNPDATEICDGMDNDCDGVVDLEEIDADQDGVPICDGDCDDGDPNAYPGAEDIPGDGIDQDCDQADAVDTSASDDVPDVKPGGCGCTSSGPAGGFALLPLLVVLGRRR